MSRLGSSFMFKYRKFVFSNEGLQVISNACTLDVSGSPSHNVLMVKYFKTSSPKGNDRSPESNVPTSSHFKQASK